MFTKNRMCDSCYVLKAVAAGKWDQPHKRWRKISASYRCRKRGVLAATSSRLPRLIEIEEGVGKVEHIQRTQAARFACVLLRIKYRNLSIQNSVDSSRYFSAARYFTVVAKAEVVAYKANINPSR